MSPFVLASKVSAKGARLKKIMNDVVFQDIMCRVEALQVPYFAKKEVANSVSYACKRFNVFPYYKRLTTSQVLWMRKQHEKYIRRKYRYKEPDKVLDMSNKIYDAIFESVTKQSYKDRNLNNTRYRNNKQRRF